MSLSISDYFSKKIPSATRIAHTEFLKRTDGVTAINVSTGNVSLPVHPAIQKRMDNFKASNSPFKSYVVKYSESQGFKETRDAFINILKQDGFNTDGLFVIVTEGASFAMEVVILGVCGVSDGAEKKMLVIDPTYTSYEELAKRTGRNIVSSLRLIKEDGSFSLPDLKDLEKKIANENIAAMLIIPYDNPTGQFLSQKVINEIAAICVKHDVWLVSDEAYRNMHYTNDKASSVWNVTEQDVPGITGHRIGIESSSKIWNGCGLRIGAIITDNQNFYDKALAECTGNLCPNVLGQYVFGALVNENSTSLNSWYEVQKTYYYNLINEFVDDFRKENPGVIISKPEASIYSVVDVSKVVPSSFDSSDFVLYCAKEGVVDVDGKKYTLLTCPMKGFYLSKEVKENPGAKQVRIAYVESRENFKLVPILFKELLRKYLQKIGK